MKRLAPLLLALALLASCAARVSRPADDLYHPETDHPYTMDSHPCETFPRRNRCDPRMFLKRLKYST